MEDSEKKCTKCGEIKDASKFRKGTSRCKVCIAAQSKIWYDVNAEKLKNKSNAWYKANLERARENKRVWRKDNLEKEKEDNRVWRKTHPEYYKESRKNSPEKFQARSKSWKEANPEKVKTTNRAWQKANPDKLNANYNRRRAKKFGQTHISSNDENIKRIYRTSSYLSKYSGRKYAVDHIIPLTKGGLHHEGNLQIILFNINNKKLNSLTYKHPDILHWTDLPQDILNLHPPEIIANAYKELNNG